MTTKEIQQQIEAIGFRVMAVTPWPDGVSYDAHRVGAKKLVRGDVAPTPEAAMLDLYQKCGAR